MQRASTVERRLRLWLARLVGHGTLSRHSNLALIDEVEEALRESGARTRRLLSPGGDRANLFASIGPELPGGIVLSGHTDVVPVEGQDWRGDPFRLREESDRFFGRGSADMKGFIAAALAWLPELAAAKLSRPVHFAFSYDEEVGCLGAPDMIRMIAAEVPRPAAVIVGEPTGMRIVNGHKGIHTLRTRVCGHQAHSSQTDRGVSAVMLAGRLMGWLAQRAQALAEQPEGGAGFEPPWTTVTVNLVRGGTAVNILAGSCDFEWDIRDLPGGDAAAVIADFERFCRRLTAEARGIAPAVSIRTEVVAAVPPLRPEVDGAAEALAAALLGAEDPPQAVSYCAEAGQFQAAGFSTVLCGPGSIAQAHRAEEFVDAAQLRRCSQFLGRLLARLAA